jgi:hypothetical protein
VEQAYKFEFRNILTFVYESIIWFICSQTKTNEDLRAKLLSGHAELKVFLNNKEAFLSEAHKEKLEAKNRRLLEA